MSNLGLKMDSFSLVDGHQLFSHFHNKSPKSRPGIKVKKPATKQAPMYRLIMALRWPCILLAAKNLNAPKSEKNVNGMSR
jgi:hypothetical protein